MVLLFLMSKKFYDLQAVDSQGELFDFEQLNGCVVLIVNTASNCGFTGQFTGFEELYEKYKDRGFIVIGFPSNQFREEPGSIEEILTALREKFSITFPMMNKIEVNGERADPVFKWLKEQRAGALGFRGIKWNFEKFLIDRTGKVRQRYSTLTTPSTIEIDVRRLLE